MLQHSRQTGAPEYEERTLAEQALHPDHLSLWEFASALEHPWCRFVHPTQLWEEKNKRR